jgi:hypothetical protein
MSDMFMDGFSMNIQDLYRLQWVMYGDVPTSTQFHQIDPKGIGEQPSFSFQSSTWTGSCSVAPVALLESLKIPDANESDGKTRIVYIYNI